MKKKLTTIISMILTAVLLTSCAGTAATTTSAAAPATTAQTTAAQTTDAETTAEETAAATTPTTAEETAAAQFPVTITDHLGRTVEITSMPETIVSGYYISTSLLIALGMEDKLVGIEAKADKRPIYKLSAPELIDLPNVGTAKEFNLEATAALKPDLVILPVKLKDAIKTLSDMGITVIGINPESQEELTQVIEMVGKATGTSARADELLLASQKLSEKAASFAKDEPAQTVYLAGNSAFLSTAGSNMYQSGLITNLGAKNAAESITDDYWAEVSYEQLLQWQPDLIVITPEAVYSADDIKNDAAVSGLTAVKEGKIYQMPKQFEAWDSPVPSGVLGELYMASILYPGKYSAAEFAADVRDFYQEFYGFEADVNA